MVSAAVGWQAVGFGGLVLVLWYCVRSLSACFAVYLWRDRCLAFRLWQLARGLAVLWARWQSVRPCLGLLVACGGAYPLKVYLPRLCGLCVPCDHSAPVSAFCVGRLCHFRALSAHLRPIRARLTDKAHPTPIFRGIPWSARYPPRPNFKKNLTIQK